MRILLHTCCGPCSVATIPHLAAGHRVTALFYNPNIHPFAEFSRRLEAMDALVAALPEGLLAGYLRRDEYGLETFLQAIGEARGGPARCRACYRLRLAEAARVAAETGHQAFTTTLLISPYQDRRGLGEVGEEEAARHGLQFLFPDLRPLFREGQRQAQELGLYRQKYCGCIFSEYEAEQGRRERQRGR